MTKTTHTFHYNPKLSEAEVKAIATVFFRQFWKKFNEMEIKVDPLIHTFKVELPSTFNMDKLKAALWDTQSKAKGHLAESASHFELIKLYSQCFSDLMSTRQWVTFQDEIQGQIKGLFK